MQLTYFSSLILFLVPPLLFLLILYMKDSWMQQSRERKYSSWAPPIILVVHVLIAVIYTTPWDNYLVANGVWWYDELLVAGLTFGYVPVEEYIFFILQTLFTGIFTILIWERMGLSESINFNHKQIRSWFSITIIILWVLSTYFLIFGANSFNYMTLIMSWALLPILLQVLFGGDILWFHRKTLLLTITFPTIYLWIMDAISIQSGIWTIDPEQTIGLNIGPLPLEEMLFFMMTNVIISFGVTLMLSPMSKIRLKLIFNQLTTLLNSGGWNMKDV